jgi:DNA invertase Pin-like site-specific DNA recombinase
MNQPGKLVCPDGHTDQVTFVETSGAWCHCGKSLVFERGLNAEERKELARDVRQSKSTVEDDGKERASMPRGKKNEPLTDDVSAAVLKELQAGTSRSKIATAFELTGSQVWHVANDAGLVGKRVPK